MKTTFSIFLTLLTLVSTLVFPSCDDKKEVDPELTDSTAVFKDARLRTDSVTVFIPEGKSVKIAMVSGDSLEVEFSEMSRSCYLKEVSCDLPEMVQLKFVRQGVVYRPIRLDLQLSGIEKRYPLVSCQSSLFLPEIKRINASITMTDFRFQNLVFAVREVSPYPISKEEVTRFSNNKSYVLKLTILNAC